MSEKLSDSTDTRSEDYKNETFEREIYTTHPQ